MATKEKIKTEESKFIILKASHTNHQSTTYNFSVDGHYVSFGLMSSPTGCGLGIFFNFTTTPVSTINNENVQKAVLEVIRQECGRGSAHLPWGLVIATLGDTFRTNYGPFLKALGFDEIHSFQNPNHGVNYKQSLWIMDVKKLSTT